MATATADEYAELDGLPLYTAAWYTNSLAALYDSSAADGEGTDLAYHHGQEPSPRWLAPRIVALPVTVIGNFDSDGDAHANVRTGLRRNLDELKAKLRPDTGGTVPLIHRHPDGDREARCQPTGPLTTRAIGPTAMRVVVDLWLPDGVMANTSSSNADGTGSAEFEVEVPNPGTADQYDATISLSGTATSVTIVSDLGHSLMYSGDLSVGAVSLKTGPMTADRVGTDVHGLVSSSYPRWLPIPAGGDTWTVTPTGGSVTLAVSHKAPWL